jgi:hypothetical protein
VWLELEAKVLAEVEIEGSTLHLRDIASFPAGTERAEVGAAALFHALRSELLPGLRSYTFGRLRITRNPTLRRDTWA